MPGRTYVCDRCGHTITVESERVMKRDEPARKVLHALARFPAARLLQSLEDLSTLLRAILGVSGERLPGADQVLVCGEVTLDAARRRALVGGREVDLTPLEFAVLAELVRQCDRVVPAAHLLRLVWGPEYEKETKYVKGVVRRLRRKIEPDPSRPRYLVTRPRVGYRLRSATPPPSITEMSP